jgi:hypothetical protein
VLDVERGDDVDARIKQDLDVFVALLPVRAGDVGMGELVNQADGGMTLDDGLDVHLLEGDAAVLDLLSRHYLEAFQELDDSFAPVRFDVTDNDVFAVATTAVSLAEHREGLADAGEGAEIDAQPAAARGPLLALQSGQQGLGVGASILGHGRQLFIDVRPPSPGRASRRWQR